MYDTFKPVQPMGLKDFVASARACITEISPRDLFERLSRVDDFLLVDVREHGEYQQGHIQGARLVPRGIIEAVADPSYPKHVPELVAARDRLVVVYCATSGRSAMAAAVLQMMGFKRVLNMSGGYVKWMEEGYPVSLEAAS